MYFKYRGIYGFLSKVIFLDFIVYYSFRSLLVYACPLECCRHGDVTPCHVSSSSLNDWDASERCRHGDVTPRHVSSSSLNDWDTSSTDLPLCSVPLTALGYSIRRARPQHRLLCRRPCVSHNARLCHQLQYNTVRYKSSTSSQIFYCWSAVKRSMCMTHALVVCKNVWTNIYWTLAWLYDIITYKRRLLCFSK